MDEKRIMPLSFWEHPKIKVMYDNMFFDDIVASLDIPFIFRKHENGMYCLGINGDTEHFRSYHLSPCFIQAHVWLDNGDRWIKDKWVSNVDADGNPIG